MHKHHLKLEYAGSYFLHFRCTDKECDKEYITKRLHMKMRFAGVNPRSNADIGGEYEQALHHRKY